MGIAIGMGKVAAAVPARYGAAGTVLKLATPFTAVASASILNLGMIRYPEMVDGVSVKDADGVERGKSQAAGKDGLFKCGVARALWNLPAVLVPTCAMAAFSKSKFMQKSFVSRFSTELTLVTACVFTGVPMGQAAYPQISTIAVSEMEPKFHGLVDAAGNPVTEMYYNKGL
jgi:hypothetical protein